MTGIIIICPTSSWNKSRLEKLDTGELISKKDYKLLCKTLRSTLPIIILNTIKKDKDGYLERATYFICVIDNLNHHH